MKALAANLLREAAGVLERNNQKPKGIEYVPPHRRRQRIPTRIGSALGKAFSTQAGPLSLAGR
jgi:hypothetical protein